MASANPVFDVSPERNLSRYLLRIREYPMLSPEDELALARRWLEHEDHAAMHQMVNSHLRLVAKIAMGYRGYGLPVSDLICEGNKGCIFEVSPEGDILREFVSPYFVQSNQFGRHNWLFRCRWYAPNSPEILALMT